MPSQSNILDMFRKAAPAPAPAPAPVNRKTPGVITPIARPKVTVPEKRMPTSSTTTGAVDSSVQGLSSGGDQVDFSKMTPAAVAQYLSQKNFMPTSAADFASIADRYKNALAGLNAPELAAQRQQTAQEVNAQTLAAQRQMRAMQGQQGIRGAAAQGGMAKIAQQGQKAVAGAENELLIRNQQIQQQALANFNNFMQGERGQRLAGMLSSADMGQRAAADAEYQSILKQYLAAATGEANSAKDATSANGIGFPQIYSGIGKLNPYNPGAYPVVQSYLNPLGISSSGVSGGVLNGGRLY